VKIDKKILIAIPALNEESTIEKVIQECKQAVPLAAVLVVDDGSTDGTVLVCQTLAVEILQLPFNIGVGGAMRAAFSYAVDEGYDFLIQVDADGQHNPTEIIKLISCIQNYDVVIGSRFLEPSGYKIEKSRRMAIRIVEFYLRLLTNVKLSDPTSGFRISNRRAIQYFSESYPVEYLGDTVGSIVLGKSKGLRFTECSVHMRPRQGGIASQGIWKSSLHLVRTLVFISMMLSRRSPERP
jgi:glycosyltransferase involved in cell wall biosynthesis